MKIPRAVWLKYKNTLAAVDRKAAADMEAYIKSLGDIDEIPWQAVEYAFALTDVYGEAAGAAACEMYEAVAQASGVKVPPAEMASLPELREVAKVVKGAFKNGSEKVVPGAVGRMVKQVGADTTLKNAQRDGAEFAWIPAGDTCAFCLTLASRGWQKISKKSLKNGHAEHIHANCDCTYAVRFDKKTTVEGYEPEKYREMYENAEGETAAEKMNSMRREAEMGKRVDMMSRKKRDDTIAWPKNGVKISKEDYQALLALGTERGIKLVSFESFDGDTELVRDFIESVSHVMDAYPRLRQLKNPIQIHVVYDPLNLSDDDYAKTIGTKIYINGYAYRDRKLLYADYAKKTEIKDDGHWFPLGTTADNIPYHEMGHVILNAYQLPSVKIKAKVLPRMRSDDRDKIIGSEISNYALSSEQELIAEAFSMYSSGITSEFVLKVLKTCGII